MPVDLATLAAPAHTAVLVMEMQRGVVGDLAAVPDLAAEVAATGIVGRIAELLTGARGAGVRVVHCTAEFRADRAGSPSNAPLLVMLARRPGHLERGSPAAEIIPTLGPAVRDIVESRLHGLSPFGGTSLDVTLRNLSVSTVVVAGVSLNLGVVGLAIEAVNLGYRVVLARDAVAGVPRDYGEAVLRHTLSMVATITPVDALLAAWSGTSAGTPQMQE